MYFTRANLDIHHLHAAEYGNYWVISGETADTIAAIDMEIKRRSSIEDAKFKPNLIAITNRKESSIEGRLNIIDICAGISGSCSNKNFFCTATFFMV